MERKVILDRKIYGAGAKALRRSRELTYTYRHQQMDLEHLALAMLTIDNSSAARMLTKVSVDVNKFSGVGITFEQTAQELRRG